MFGFIVLQAIALSRLKLPKANLRSIYIVPLLCTASEDRVTEFVEKQFLKKDFYGPTPEHVFVLKQINQSIFRFLSNAGLAQVCKTP